MYLEHLASTWNGLAEVDHMWAVLMKPGCEHNRWDARAFFETGRADIVHVLHKTCHLPFPLRRGRALDFGCGVGRLSQALAVYFDRVDGVDIAPAMIRQARAFNPYGDRCTFHVNARDDLSQFESNQFDLVLSLLVFQHMRADYAKRYLAELVRVLAPGGLLLFQQPTHYSPQPGTMAATTPQHWFWGPIERLAHCAYDVVTPWPKLARRGFHYSSVTYPRYAYSPPLLGAESVRFDTGESDISSVPNAETHTIPRWKVMLHLRRLGARVMGVEPREECTPHHPSLRYYATK